MYRGVGEVPVHLTVLRFRRFVDRWESGYTWTWSVGRPGKTGTHGRGSDFRSVHCRDRRLCGGVSTERYGIHTDDRAVRPVDRITTGTERPVWLRLDGPGRRWCTWTRVELSVGSPSVVKFCLYFIFHFFRSVSKLFYFSTKKLFNLF